MASDPVPTTHPDGWFHITILKEVACPSGCVPPWVTNYRITTHRKYFTATHVSPCRCSRLYQDSYSSGLGPRSPYTVDTDPYIHKSWGFVPLGYCPLLHGFLSPLDFVPLGFCPPWILSHLDIVPLGFCLGFCPPGFLSSLAFVRLDIVYGVLSSGILSWTSYIDSEIHLFLVL